MEKFASAPSIRRAAPPRIEELLARAGELAPVFAERAAQTEELRRLPPENEADLHASGLYRMLQPKRVGGSECDYAALITLGAAVAQGCASTAWNLTNLASHHWMLAMFPEAAQRKLWDDNPDVLIASSFVFPAAKVKSVAGGYLLSGRWPFSSGVDPSEWNMLAGIVRDGDAPDHRVFLVHRADYTVLDTWHTSALKGTGSNDVVLDEVFVPTEMTVSVAHLKGGSTPGSGLNPSPLYQLPVFALFPAILSGVGLGNAEAAYASYVSRSASRSSSYSGAKLGELQSTQINIGSAGTRLSLARRTMVGICDEATELARRGVVPDIDAKLAYRRDLAFATKLCTEAVDLIIGASGAAALYTSSPLQRQFRDAHGVAAHIAFSMDVATAAYGRVALGLPTDNDVI
jgi:3-hydroxy-9,10-secoandrosta-1,3,5(10)-triene-9,17-dione monooxygenase